MSAEIETQTREVKNRQVVKGRVVSDKMDKTRVIEISRIIMHPLYLKRMRRKHRLFIHDEKNESKAGDYVSAVSCRPLSKNKAFRMKAILERAVQ